ncbi:sugar O-acyltransferase (sialic acid O-acetyltransferase NeuD family) [Mesoflavibacter sabulilitoris]|uniref:Sugar O-acyltransferase n=1 Tax=Mesoflavibacter zeaxanthinifaciens subsp. sabulilitoris TaxID=1520893 RepID=A0A2T1NB57_9FLAO|nr:acetyltransferase [Mesoflavibacter zeaxanthinifaciens]MBB3123546.1 sugar O-acyltransferase (sialic acid O-acetyltransferase NeuD family) [Mesoflavibacter zeaxanthinifaciens subsp. sabulilitoris]PSG89323.1 sugar O-acyltransferase [Mesoflavibacter zeaxanthinifaciens subsp. sabulilitoris]
MAKVIIFGLLDTAELAHYYLENDSEHEVVAFTVSKEYIDKNEFKGLPVVPFEDIETIYPPDQYHLFAPMTAKQMNQLREKIYLEGKSKGYKYISYISSKATVFDNEIGENCFILEDNTIQPFTKIGNNVVLWSGNHIGHHGEIKDHVFFTSHVVMSGHCIIESYCFFGVNATIRDYTHLAKGTLLAMGASLTKQKTDEWRVYVGNPAKKLEGKLSYKMY